VRHVLLEGGPTLAGAFLRAQAIDTVHWYIAPLLLGAGPVALPVEASDDGSPLGVDVEEVSVVGQDVRVVGRIRYE
jgi:diaminohydroxyphosphoribosylaminopyrimidine deaminase / 5-amino-6-(5-phosphoribosylamino)uracil reductase